MASETAFGMRLAMMFSALVRSVWHRSSAPKVDFSTDTTRNDRLYPFSQIFSSTLFGIQPIALTLAFPVPVTSKVDLASSPYSPSFFFTSGISSSVVVSFAGAGSRMVMFSGAGLSLPAVAPLQMCWVPLFVASQMLAASTRLAEDCQPYLLPRPSCRSDTK